MIPLAKLLEAALFASGRPISPQGIGGTGSRRATPAAVQAALSELHLSTMTSRDTASSWWRSGTAGRSSRGRSTRKRSSARRGRARPQRLSGAALEDALATSPTGSPSVESRSKRFAACRSACWGSARAWPVHRREDGRRRDWVEALHRHDLTVSGDISGLPSRRTAAAPTNSPSALRARNPADSDGAAAEAGEPTDADEAAAPPVPVE